MNPWISAAWITLLVIGLALEFYGLHRKGKGDTLSENVWWLLRRSPVVWFCVAGLLLWTGLHFLSFGRVDDLFP